ncbi:hypothetical protein DMUE_1147 [Dictyocoela muelleri]|nr:hypothetical protein DMUE_1147 [Dictyocoela muelleri]
MVSRNSSGHLRTIVIEIIKITLNPKNAPGHFFRLVLWHFFRKKTKIFYPYGTEKTKIHKKEEIKLYILISYIISEEKNDDIISWQCNRRDCSGRIQPDKNVEKVLLETTHWHENEKNIKY